MNDPLSLPLAKSAVPTVWTVGACTRGWGGVQGSVGSALDWPGPKEGPGAWKGQNALWKPMTSGWIHTPTGLLLIVNLKVTGWGAWVALSVG